MGSKSALYDFPKLVRSFDEFTHSTIPLTYEQLVEQFYVQDGNVEELIAFDQQDTVLVAPSLIIVQEPNHKRELRRCVWPNSDLSVVK